MGTDQGRSRPLQLLDRFCSAGLCSQPCSSTECPMGLQGLLGPLLWGEHFRAQMLGAEGCGFQPQLPECPEKAPEPL